MFVGYARVSTRDQSPALQVDALREAGCERVFMEKVSGAKRDRPELGAALDYIRAGDTLVVWKLDRLARSVRQLVDTAEDLQRRAIGLKVLTQAIDTTTPGGRLVFHVFAAVAEFERELMLERTHAGLTQAKALGRRGGRKPALGPAEIRRAKAMLADRRVTRDIAHRRYALSYRGHRVRDGRDPDDRRDGQSNTTRRLFTDHGMEASAGHETRSTTMAVVAGCARPNLKPVLGKFIAFDASSRMQGRSVLAFLDVADGVERDEAADAQPLPSLPTVMRPIACSRPPTVRVGLSNRRRRRIPNHARGQQPNVLTLAAYLQGFQPTDKILDLVHCTPSIIGAGVLQQGELRTRACDVYGEDLLYLFYGRPAFKPLAGLHASNIDEHLPMCLVLDPELIGDAVRIFPFDSGGYARCDQHVGPLLGRADFELGPDRTHPMRLVRAFYETNRNYYVQRPTADANAIPLSQASARAFARLAADPGMADDDDRRSTVEIQLGRSVPLAAALKAIVGPAVLMEDPAVLDALDGCPDAVPVTYTTFGRQQPSAYSGLLYDRVHDLFTRAGAFG